MIKRPTWREYFMALAWIIKDRSHDAETKHGAIAVDQDNKIIGTGYNGFPRYHDDDSLPNARPEKYLWMIHAEANLIYNMVGREASLKGSTIYVTGYPCLECVKAMIQCGVKQIFCMNRISKCLPKDYFDKLHLLTNNMIDIIPVEFNFDEYMAKYHVP